MQMRRRTLWTIAVAVVAVVLAVLLILIAFGFLVLPGSAPPAPVTISAVQFTLLQGTNASGNGWFGPSTFTYTGIYNGFPFHVSPGGSFSVPVILENFDDNPHTLYSVSVQPPFLFESTSPALPQTMVALQDDALLTIYAKAPSSPGETLELFVTINALPP